MKLLGIIPARGGSKGIPRKNLACINGVPLVVRAARAALKSGVLHRIVLDSDDDEIISAVHGLCGVEVLYKRPKWLSGDDARTSDVVSYMLDWLKSKQDYSPEGLVLLEPTCPLRTAQDIRFCVQTWIKSGKPSLITVSEPLQHPWDFIFQAHGGKWEFVVQEGRAGTRRQEHPNAWFINGGVYITYSKYFLATRKFYELENTAVYSMDVSHSFDIDTPFQLEIARCYASIHDTPDLET